MHGTLPYLPSVAAHYFPTAMQMIAKVPGSTWLYPYQSKSWPVLLCDEEIPPEPFMMSRPNSYVFPAILLGKVIYIWVADVHLRPFDFTADYLKDAEPSQDALEVARREAFTEHAGHRHSPAFWKNYIIQRSLAREAEHEIDRKRAAPTSDNDEEITFVRTQKKASRPSTPKKVKLYHSSKERRDSHRPTPDITSAKSALSAELVDNSDDDDLFVREAKPRAGLYLSDCNGIDQEERESGIEANRAKNMQAVHDNPPDQEWCTIFVGESWTPFQVKICAVRLCEFLSTRIHNVKGLGSVIELGADTTITSKDFITVAEFLQNGEFCPRLIETPEGQRLDGVVLQEEKYDAAGMVARTYTRASSIQFEHLQSLCVDKLKALHPYTPTTLMSVVGFLSKRERNDNDAESELMRWMVDLLTESFWAVVRSDANITLERVMRGDAGLRQMVVEKLASDPAMGFQA